jgi:mono/diheme cytochrome c family protein
VPAASSARAGLLELVALGAVALGLLTAAAVVLLADEPALRGALGAPRAAEPAAGLGPGERGRLLFQTTGCVGCHAAPGIERGNAPEVGPNLGRLPDVAPTRRPGMSAASYVAESIRDPGAFVVPGYEAGVTMPRFDLSPADVEALTRFLLGQSEPSAQAAAPGGTAPRADGLPDQTPPPPRVLERSFDPAPPGAAYPTVWVGDDVTMVIRFADGPQPSGEVLTHFAEDDGYGGMTVTVRAEQIGPQTWRASFALPRVGRWEGRHELAGAIQNPPPFALRAIRPGG